MNWTAPDASTPPPDTEVIGAYSVPDINGADVWSYSVMTCQSGFWSAPPRNFNDGPEPAHAPDFWSHISAMDDAD